MSIKLRLECGPEGAPNSCFGLYRVDTGECAAFIQNDWDYAGLATDFGWTPCQCGGTDGTIDCKDCGRTVSEMLAEAYDFLSQHDGDVIDDPGYCEETL